VRGFPKAGFFRYLHFQLFTSQTFAQYLCGAPGLLRRHAQFSIIFYLSFLDELWQWTNLLSLRGIANIDHRARQIPLINQSPALGKTPNGEFYMGIAIRLQKRFAVFLIHSFFKIRGSLEDIVRQIEIWIV